MTLSFQPRIFRKSISFPQNLDLHSTPLLDHYFIKLISFHPGFLSNYVELDQPLPYL